MLDADLFGLTTEHIHDLVSPVVAGEADMAKGVFREGRWNTDLAHRLTPWLSGQRCVKREFLGKLDRHAAQGYGFEVTSSLTAGSLGLRVKWVILRGVHHTPSETHRGLLRGLLNRVFMYGQIMRSSWRLLRPLPPVRRLAPAMRAAIALLLLLALLAVACDYSMARTHIRLEDLPPLSITQGSRLFVVAPHPDDEVIGAGGLIQEVLGRGGRVRGVVMTNGDGRVAGPVVVDRRLRSGSSDCVAWGTRREAETLEALRRLGVPTGDVLFLGYPDRGLYPEWIRNWTTDCPWLGRYTRSFSSPYPSTYRDSRPYCGDNILEDLGSIVADF